MKTPHSPCRAPSPTRGEGTSHQHFQIPGKTFLLGEYAVLQGGTAIIACTSPFFELHVLPDNGRKNPFHPQSPAGKFIADHLDIFNPLHLTWTSPYGGGFGGSTAEFLACVTLYAKLTLQTFSSEQLYTTYLKYAYNQKGIAPSGVDLIAQAQMQEGLVFVQPNLQPAIDSWPFKDLALLLFKTPDKLPTHHYLQDLKKTSNYTELSKLVLKGHEAIKNKNAASFIEIINDYADSLKSLALTAEATLDILKKLTESQLFLAAKGCGALGVDVIAVLIPVQNQQKGISFCKELGLSFVQKITSACCMEN